MKIEIELFEMDFKYKGIEIWASEDEESHTYYEINEHKKLFLRLSDAIEWIDNYAKH